MLITVKLRLASFLKRTHRKPTNIATSQQNANMKYIVCACSTPSKGTTIQDTTGNFCTQRPSTANIFTDVSSEEQD